MSYVIYKFMKIFFDKKRSSDSVEAFFYIGYTLVISFIYFFIKIPIILLVSNILLFFGLTFNYFGSIKQRLLTTLYLYTTLFFVEIIAAAFTGYLQTNILAKSEYNSILAIIFVRILSYLIVLIIENCKNIKNGNFVSLPYWLSIFIIPLGTSFLLSVIFFSGVATPNLVAISVIIVLLINILAFYLYDSIAKFFTERMEKKLVTQQNIYYENQLELMKISLDSNKSLRHDLKNHISFLYEIAKTNDNQEVMRYLSNIFDVYSNNKEHSKSGNISIDSIINFKLQQADEENIDTKIDISIPNDFSMSPFDVAVILGNLLDNAISGAKTAPNDKWVHINIKHSKSLLIIKISNSFDGVVLKENNLLITRKQDKENHGLGIKNIENILNKYDGALEFDYTEEMFSTKILMYIN